MDLIAFRRRDQIVLAAVLQPPGEADVRLGVCTEDGRSIRLDSRGVVARWSDDVELPPDPLEPSAASIAEHLGAVRRQAGDAPDWEHVHGQLQEESVLTLDEIAAACGVADGKAPLAWILSLSSASPWLRRAAAGPDGPGGFRVVAREVALAEHERAASKRRRGRENGLLHAWWKAESSDPLPDEAQPALAALRAYAVAPAGAAKHDPLVERGRVLAARLDLPEADHVIEAGVAKRVFPADLDPSPTRAGLAEPFSARVLAEVAAITRVVALPKTLDRVDYRDLFTVSVDDADTIEVDDAVSVRQVGDGRELLVHISDVAAEMPLESELDRVARARGTSMYTPDGIVTLLPRALVSDVLSLDRETDRQALTAAFPIDAQGAVGPPRFERSLVRVDRALNYAQATEAAAWSADGAVSGAEQGSWLLDFGRQLRERRIAGGAISLDLGSLKLTLEDGRPRRQIRDSSAPADRLVSESMILFNGAVGDLLAAAGRAALYRSQEPPRGPLPEPGTPLRDLIGRRLLSPARTFTEPKPHAGLGLAAYAQSSSPIRRYGDLINQRLLCDVLDGRPASVNEHDLLKLAQHLAERERIVRTAAHGRDAFWMATSLLARSGKTIEGRLARAPRRGLGSVLVPELARELPLRAPRGWEPPDLGTLRDWTIASVRPQRGRVELAP